MDQEIAGSRDMKEMRGFMQQILQMMNSQIGQSSTPPANLGFISNSAVSVAGQHNVVILVTQQDLQPDPPPNGSG